MSQICRRAEVADAQMSEQFGDESLLSGRLEEGEHEKEMRLTGVRRKKMEVWGRGCAKSKLSEVWQSEVEHHRFPKPMYSDSGG